MAHEVFISYSSKDKVVADQLCATLESQGIPCWIAPRNITYGSDYGEAIVDGINDSRVMVLVFSSHANTSQHIKREVDRAVSKGLTIIPIRIEDVAPTRALEYYISPVHWLEAVDPPLEPHFTALGEKIRVLLDKASADRSRDPSPTPVAAPKPARARVEPAAVVTPAATARAAPDTVDTTPAQPSRGTRAIVGGVAAAIVVAAMLWLQPWNPGDKTDATKQAQIEEQRRQDAARQAQNDEQRKQDAARQAQAEEQRKQDTARQAQAEEQRKQDAARQAQLDEQRRRDMDKAEATRRAADEATKRAEDAARRLEAARQAEEQRVARALAEQKAKTQQMVPAAPPTPGPVARIEPGAAKNMVEQKLRDRGLLKQSGGGQWGVTVDINGAGVVTLTGVLQNNEQRNETVRLAGEVPGVTEVKQRINVQQSWNTR